MRRFIKYLLPALLLALCLSLAACGSGGDTDTDTDAAPDSFEGMVKDSERMASLSDYGGTWAGDDGSTMLIEAGGDGDPTMVDCGTIRVERSGEETLYYAVSTRFADVTYDFTLIDSNTMYWGGEYDYYQKMA